MEIRKLFHPFRPPPAGEFLGLRLKFKDLRFFLGETEASRIACPALAGGCNDYSPVRKRRV